MLRDDERTPFNLISLTKAGLSLAEYPQIRAALVQRFKEIYGSDIDLSTTSADGIYLETMSLMINNLMQTIKTLYSELDIKTATGIYLDSLCALSGIYRKESTNSTAILLVTNNGEENIEVTTSSPLSFIDENGNEWVTNLQVGQSIILEPNIETALSVKAVTPGPLVAPKGWINRLLTTEYSLTIVQEEDAELGTYEESDSQLRKRRNQSMSTKGISILEAMAGALLNITGIDDVKIYNNDSDENIYSNDGSLIKPHSIYVILRERGNIIISDTVIGSIIYEKLTPGIGTNQSTPTYSNTGTNKTYKYTQYILGTPYEDESLLQNVHWKVAKPLGKDNLTITIKLKKKEYFSSYNSHTVNIIVDSIKQYLNNLQISEKFTDIDLINVVNDADPQFRGQKTYNCQSVDLTTTDDILTGPLYKLEDTDNIVNYYTRDTYFDISTSSIQVNTDEDLITIIIT